MHYEKISDVFTLGVIQSRKLFIFKQAHVHFVNPLDDSYLLHLRL